MDKSPKERERVRREERRRTLERVRGRTDVANALKNKVLRCCSSSLARRN